MRSIIIFVITLIVSEIQGQITYISLEDSVTVKHLMQKNKIKEYPVEAVIKVYSSNDTLIAWNYPFNAPGLRSEQISICTSDSVNEYDARILGTWSSFNNNFITIIAKNSNGKGFFVKKYLSENGSPFVFQESHPITFTKIDTTYFVERGMANNRHGIDFGAIKYSFTNEDELVCSPMSLSYVPEKPYWVYSHPMQKIYCSFHSTGEYRSFVRKKISNPDFFTNGYRMHRFTGTFAKVPGEENPQSQALTNGLLLLLGAAIFSGDGSKSSSSYEYQSSQKHLQGYTREGNPVYDGVNTSGKIYYDANGKPK